MGRWEFLGAFAIAAIALVVVRFGPPYAYLFGSTSAAWVQAAGVFIAVVWSGKLARDLARAQDISRREQLVASVLAVIGKIATEVNDVPAALVVRWQGVFGADPRIRLRTVLDALTPKRIHELPDEVLVGLAIDIASNLAEFTSWLDRNMAGFSVQTLKPPNIPDHILGLINTIGVDCAAFAKQAARGEWR